MFIKLSTLGTAGISAAITEDDVLVISANEPMNIKDARAIQGVCDRLGLTAREGDEVLDHIGNKTIFSALRRLSD
jgi:hypothetical protein